jgi:type IV pilus assembly protein PilY1
MVGLSLSTAAVGQALSNKPVFDVRQVKTNVFYTMDDSGSMTWTHVPDGNNNTLNPEGRFCYRNAQANALYYNPNINYLPPLLGDGVTRLPNASFDAAPIDGYPNGNTLGTRNLATQFSHTCHATGNTATVGSYQSNCNRNTNAHYYNYTGAGVAPNTCTGSGTSADGNYTRVDITAASPAAVKQSFANWYSYYRTRMWVLRGATAEAFAAQGDEIRAGFGTLNTIGNQFLNVSDFTGTHRDDWYTRLFRQVPGSGTPFINASRRVGEYFRTGVMPDATGSVDPIQYSCQVNAHLLATDGYWNQTVPVTVGDTDDTVPVLPVTVTGLTAGAPWPAPFRQNTAAAGAGEFKANVMSDVAMFYWATDLRPAMVNNVPANTELDAGTNPLKDPATWQHLNTYGVSIDARGDLPFVTRTATNGVKSNDVAAQPSLQDIIAGTRVWPNPINNNPRGIDDLWHAAINSRGLYFNANSPSALRDSISEALADASSKSSTAAQGALDNPSLGVGGSDITFVPSYKSGVWSGNVVAKTLDPVSGLTTGDIWNVAGKLNLQNWDTGRRIITRNGANFVPLRWNSLSTAQQNSLDIRPDATLARRQAVLEYLRGNRYHESESAPGSFSFRKRDSTNPLGDVVNVVPGLVDPPSAEYADGFNAGYSAFKAANAARRSVLYFGANDGMIHAVDARASATLGGRELWAYMPSELFRSNADGVGSLVWKATDNIPYKFDHRFYVDASVVVTDVDFDRTSPNNSTLRPNGGATPTPTWRTIAITGMGKGGKSYIAIDATVPVDDSATESAVATAGKVLWEFTEADMGFTYGKAYITRTARYGWVAILPGGYQNTTGPNAGKGIVYVVDVKTGALLHKFITSAGTAAEPSGLAHIEGFIPDKTKFETTELYAGDLLGNLWRFNVKDAAPYSAGGTLLATLRTTTPNKGQPVTTVARPSIDPKTGTRYVFVGTGKLLDRADLPCPPSPPLGLQCVSAANEQTQSFYAIKDGTTFSVLSPSTPLLRADLTPVVRTNVTGAVPDATSKGWYIDLAPTERVTKDPIPNFGVIAFSTDTPSTDICVPGAFGTAYARKFVTSDSVVKNATGTNNVAFFGGVGTPAIVGIRFLRSSPASGRKILGTITDALGNVSKFDVEFPPRFIGVGVNYREILN